MRGFLLTVAIASAAATVTLAFIPFASAHIETIYAGQVQPGNSENSAPVVQQNLPGRCDTSFVKLIVALSGKACV